MKFNKKKKNRNASILAENSYYDFQINRKLDKMAAVLFFSYKFKVPNHAFLNKIKLLTFNYKLVNPICCEKIISINFPCCCVQ